VMTQLQLVVVVVVIIIKITYQEIAKLRNYRKQPYWALHTYFGKC